MAQAIYITVEELTIAHDIRALQNLGADDAADGTADDTNVILLNAIERASADVESFSARGGIYSLKNLGTLRDLDDWTLKGLCVDLAIGHAYRRRGGRIPAELSDRVDKAESTLADLRDGKRVFSQDAEAIAAGKPRASVVSLSQRERINSVSDTLFYPQRKERVI